jgi:hypothetical protein
MPMPSPRSLYSHATLWNPTHPHNNAFILLIPLPRPLGPLPAAKVLDLAIRQAQIVERLEQPPVVRKSAEAHAMRRVAVVEARISRFCGVEIAVEGLDFDADFGNEVTGEMGGEGRRVVGGGIWEEAIRLARI